MKRFAQLIIPIATLLVSSAAPAQSVPQLINYQGQLLDASGTPLTNGDYVIEVRLFAADSGGTPIWGPQVFNGQGGVGFGRKVPVVQGRFNLVFGPQDVTSQSLAAVFATNPTVYLELKVGSGNPISPRQQILSSPFALSAANAENALNAQNAVNAQNAANAQNAVNAQNAATAQTAVNAQNATMAQNALNADNATSAQSAVTAQSATTATSAATAQNANNAANASKLNGYDWSTLFTGANPALGALTVAAADVRGDVTIGTGSSDYRKILMGGGNSWGYLYGSYPRFGDGLHLSYNYFADAGGGDHLFATDGGSSRLTVGYGFVGLYVGGVGAAPTTQRLLATTSGVTVNGTFNNSSDRNVKQDFTPVDPAKILEKVVRLPVTEWSYKVDPTTRHVGPVAQDFHSIFSLGTDERHIAPMDEGGVALASIQALNKKLEERDEEIRLLAKRLEKLEHGLPKHAQAAY